MKAPRFETITLDKVVGGGQTMGILADGRKAFVWGGLPGEVVTVQITKTKSHLAEGIVTDVITPSPERIAPRDPATYLSTSPWQIMDFAAEQCYKAALIDEAFALHKVQLPGQTPVFTDNQQYHYRNKVEFSWYGSADEPQSDEAKERLDLAFFRRGSKGKVVVTECALLPAPMLQLALKIRDFLQTQGVQARQLKTLLIRCDQHSNCVWQLYVKTPEFPSITSDDMAKFGAQGGEIIYSNPKSPASVITERLQTTGNSVLTDTILGVPFRYATEGFFQVNIPVYEQALRDMAGFVGQEHGAVRHHSKLDLAPSNEESADRIPVPDRIKIRTSGKASPVSVESLTPSAPLGEDMRLGGNRASSARDIAPLRAATGGNDASGEGSHYVLDLYSGVGSIGLTIGGDAPELVEINADAVREMRRNITGLGSHATAILAPSEQALDYITHDKIVIVDPPRAGLHADVVNRLLETTPPRIIYLSCNPTTQARDVALLLQQYKIVHHQGYNFFPRTPHIEHLVVLDYI